MQNGQQRPWCKGERVQELKYIPVPVPVTVTYFHTETIMTMGLHCRVSATDGVELENQYDTVLGIHDVSAMKETQKVDANEKLKIFLLMPG